MGNDYLEGNYAPVRRECTITELVVTGTIPAHLDGRYLRNGPNPIGEVDPDTYHWFTGDGMVHGVRLRDGKAQWYRNRWIRTPAAARALGETVPRRAPIRAGLEFLGANTNVLSHAGHTLALIESGTTSYELTEALDTVGPCDFDGTLHGGYTAYPKRDPDTGELHAVSYSFGRGNRVQYSVIGVLMGFVHDAVPDRSDLVLLDASSLEVIAAIHLPVRVPFGFHGNWLPSAPRPTTH
jgi:carotenoid cleavage dioxygenase